MTQFSRALRSASAFFRAAAAARLLGDGLALGAAGDALRLEDAGLGSGGLHLALLGGLDAVELRGGVVRGPGPWPRHR